VVAGGAHDCVRMVLRFSPTEGRAMRMGMSIC